MRKLLIVWLGMAIWVLVSLWKKSLEAFYCSEIQSQGLPAAKLSCYYIQSLASLLYCVSCMSCRPAWSKFPRVNISINLSTCQFYNFACQRASLARNMLTCQRRAKGVPTFELGVPLFQRSATFSLWRGNKPKNVPVFQLCLSKDVPICQLHRQKACQSFNYFSKEHTFQFLNFSIMLDIFNFQEYLGNWRKFISQNIKNL